MWVNFHLSLLKLWQSEYVLMYRHDVSDSIKRHKQRYIEFLIGQKFSIAYYLIHMHMCMIECINGKNIEVLARTQGQNCTLCK